MLGHPIYSPEKKRAQPVGYAVSPALQDRGSALWAEDVVINKAPFFGVLDGVSEAHGTKTTGWLFDGQSGGARVVALVRDIFNSAPASAALKDLVITANRKVAQFIKNGYPSANVYEPGWYPGTCGVIAKIDSQQIHLVQWGDCLAAAETVSGQLWATPSQIYDHDRLLTTKYRQCQTLALHNKSEVWDEYFTYFAQGRNERCNRSVAAGYGLLNGQETFPNFIFEQRFAPGELLHLVLFSDGLVRFEDTADACRIAQRVIPEYLTAGRGLMGLKEILGATRQVSPPHTKYPEASALAIDFDNSGCSELLAAQF